MRNPVETEVLTDEKPHISGHFLEKKFIVYIGQSS